MAQINEIELLNYVRQNTEMALDGIEMVETGIKGVELKNTVSAQKTEYTNLYSEADALLRKKNGEPENVSVMRKMSTEVMGAMKKMTYRNDTDIADSMITGTTMGITKLTKHLHEYKGNDKEIVDLANKTIAFEEDCVEKLKPYL